MGRNRLLAGLVLWLAAFPEIPIRAQNQHTEQQTQLLDRSHETYLEALKFRGAGDLPAALSAARKAFEYERQAVGDTDVPIPGTLGRLVQYELQAGQVEPVKQLLKSIRSAREKSFAATHWTMRELDRWEEDAAAVQLWTDEKRAKLRHIGHEMANVMIFLSEGKQAEARQLIGKENPTRAEVWGTDHYEYALGLYIYGVLSSNVDSPDEVRRNAEKTLSILEGCVAKDHPTLLNTAETLLGNLRAKILAEAPDLIRENRKRSGQPVDDDIMQMVEIAKRIYGEESAEYGLALNDLATREYYMDGASRRALDHQKQAVELLRRAKPASEELIFALGQIGQVFIYSKPPDTAAAFAAFEECVSTCRIVYKDKESRHFLWLPVHIDVCVSMGEFTRAESYARELLQRSEEQSGTDSAATAKALATLIRLLRYQQKLVEAQLLSERRLELVITLHGKESAEYAEALQSSGELYLAANDVKSAESQLQLAYKISSRLPDQTELSASALQRLADVKQRLGAEAESIALHRQAIELRRQGDPVALQFSLTTLGLQLNALNRYSEAVDVLREAASLRQSLYGPNSLEFGEIQDYLATSLVRLGLKAKVAEAIQQADLVFDQYRDKNPRAMAIHLGSRGSVESLLQQNHQALATFLEAAAIWHDLKSAEEATSLVLAALMESKLGDWDSAEHRFREAYGIQASLLGTEHSKSLATLQMLHTFGVECLIHGRTEQGERLTADVALWHPHWRKGSIQLAALFRSAGLKSLGLGDALRSAAYFERALELERRFDAPEHQVAETLLSLAGTQRTIGQIERSRSNSADAAEAFRKLTGDQTAEYGEAMANWGFAEISSGDVASGLPRLEQAVAILRNYKQNRRLPLTQGLIDIALTYYSLGDRPRMRAIVDELQLFHENRPDHEAMLDALVLPTVALLQFADQQTEPALATMTRAVELTQASLGEHHIVTASFIGSLASMQAKARRLGEAFDSYQMALEALSTQGENAQYVEAILKQERAELFLISDEPSKALVDLKAARKSYESNRLLDSNLGIALLVTQARASHMSSDVPAARLAASEAAEIGRRLLHNAFGVLSERQQLAVAEVVRRVLDLNLSLADTATDEIYPLVLAWKGQVFSQQRRLRTQRANPELNDLFEKLVVCASQLSTGEIDPAIRKSQGLPSIQSLQDQRDTLEAELIRKSPAFAESRDTSLRKLTNCLPDDSILIDFLEYDRDHFGKYTDNAWPGERSMVAFIVRRGETVARVELGPVTAIRASLEGWRPWEPVPLKDAARHAEELRLKIWLPLEPYLVGYRQVYLSPDGTASRIPFAALPGAKPSTFLVEDYTLAYINIPHLLPMSIADHRPEATFEKLVLVADVDYGNPPVVSNRNPTFERLEGFRNELEAVRDRWQSRVGPESLVVLSGSEATESNLRDRVVACDCLHIATHGIAMTDAGNHATPPALAIRGVGGVTHTQHLLTMPHANDQFARLALSGANLGTRQGEVDDGCLSAIEVASLDLSSVRLAVLSACESNVGTSIRGEGVFGLQRAFETAGVRTTVASLWKVSDVATVALMSEFYRELLDAKRTPADALRAAQLTMLRTRRFDLDTGSLVSKNKDEQSSLSPFFWAAFHATGID